MIFQFTRKKMNSGTANMNGTSGYRVMNMIVMLAGIMLLAHCSAGCAGQNIPVLINNLAIDETGNNTCNTSFYNLAALQDTAVPALTAALQHENPRVRYYTVRCLGEINTQKSRMALISAFSDGMPDVRKHVPYVLAWHPHPEAEPVYLAFLAGAAHSSVDLYTLRYVVKALGVIHSQNAVPLLRAICDNPPDWYNYYEALQTLRKIEGQELPPEIVSALDCLRDAKHGDGVNEDTLALAMQIVKRNLSTVLPDVCNMFLAPMPKQIRTGIEPDVEIIANAGVRAYPYLRISLRANDGSTTHQARRFIEALALEDDFRVELQQLAAQQLAAANQRRADTTTAGAVSPQTDDDIYGLSLGEQF